ncbi:endo alpha-1,4 polygalactosaminidase (plasmid) [Deinococcus radiomollis]|uniref:endo alpha-1,4 polygalactosaminidase n=1 Tax=Deinococcus radiomollis TaxID=468916 RepID=UPI003891998C
MVAQPEAPVSPSPSRHRHELAIYYGQGALPTLARYRRVVVQPGHFGAEKVQWLQQRGVQVLAYLSLGEVEATDALWATGEYRPEWNTKLVDLTSPVWRAQVQDQVLREKGIFDGFFLDTLESATDDPRQMRAMLKLVRSVRQWAGPKYLMANRGFELLKRLRGTINGVLIEAFSTTWADGYRPYTRQELTYTAELLKQAKRLKMDVYALDYADSPRQRRFAMRRALTLGVPTFVTNRELSLPKGYLPAAQTMRQ